MGSIMENVDRRVSFICSDSFFSVERCRRIDANTVEMRILHPPGLFLDCLLSRKDMAREMPSSSCSWDGNPATLVPLSPEDSAPLYAEMMGGSEKIMAKAKELNDQGKYRYSVEILNKLVYAEPQKAS